MTETDTRKPAQNPRWFRLLNLIFLLPCLAWPVLLVGLAFSDSPKYNVGLAILFVFGYPVVLVVMMLNNAKLFSKNEAVATIMPIVSVPVLSILGVYIYFGLLFGFNNSNEFYNQDEVTRKAPVSGYKITDDRSPIFFDDSELTNVDRPSFTIIDTNEYWAIDKGHVYIYGQILFEADSTFRYLGNNYCIRQSAVYYIDKPVTGADVSTFMLVTESMYDAKDKNACYYCGGKVDCKELSN